MSLAHLYDPLINQDDLYRFSNYNYTDHVTVVGVLAVRKSVTLNMLDIRFLLPENMALWAFNHQAMHDATNAVFGLPGSNFVHIDLNDPGQVESMRWLHAEEHRQWHQLLGI